MANRFFDNPFNVPIGSLGRSTSLKAALEACERYYQAFQFVVWAGKAAQEALKILRP